MTVTKSKTPPGLHQMQVEAKELLERVLEFTSSGEYLLDEFMEAFEDNLVTREETDLYLVLDRYKIIISVDGYGSSLPGQLTTILKKIVEMTDFPELPMLGTVSDGDLEDLRLAFNRDQVTKYPIGGKYKLGPIDITIHVDDPYPTNLMGFYVDLGWGPILIAMTDANHQEPEYWAQLDLVKKINRSVSLLTTIA